MSEPPTPDVDPSSPADAPTLAAENAALRTQVADLHQEVARQAQRLAEAEGYQTNWQILERSPGWLVLQGLQNLRAAAVPLGSRRARWLDGTARRAHTARRGTISEFFRPAQGGRRPQPSGPSGRLGGWGNVISVPAVSDDVIGDTPGGIDARMAVAEQARAAVSTERVALTEAGRAAYAGRRILFVLPVAEPGGGASVIMREAEALSRMGVAVTLFNLTGYRRGFEAGYPDLTLPIVYGAPEDVPTLSLEFDAVLATAHTSIDWLPRAVPEGAGPVLGYFIQDFEPYFYPPGSAGFEQAWWSYTARPNLVRVTKSDWNRLELQRRIGVACVDIGPSFDVDLFRPRPRRDPPWPARPVRVAAMVRPGSRYRQPAFTMSVLQTVARQLGPQVEIVLFGARPDDPQLLDLPHAYPWTLAGVLNPRQMAALLNEVDVFADLSLYQALGIASLEAMACGAAVVAPAFGGSHTFARHNENALLVDTTVPTACVAAIASLVEDVALRQRLAGAGLVDVARYYPEGPAFRLLTALFGPAAPAPRPSA